MRTTPRSVGKAHRNGPPQTASKPVGRRLLDIARSERDPVPPQRLGPTRAPEAHMKVNREGSISSAGRRSFCLSVLACLFFAAGGCAVDENREIALYRAVLDGPAAPRVDYAPGEPLSLPNALLLANQHNERIALGGEDYVQALIEKARAASAFFPTISFVPSYSKSDAADDRGGRRLQGGGTADENELLGRSSLSSGDGNLDVPINLNANVFRGFRDVANLNRAKADVRRFRALLLDLQASVLLDVARAYYQVLRLERSVQVLESSATLQNARVDEMCTRDRLGAARKLDVAQIEAQAAATRASLIAARADARNARTLLAYLVGAPVADAPLVDQLDPAAADQPAEAFVQRAWHQRQDLAAAESAAQSAAQNVRRVVGEYYPSISLNLNYYLARDSSPEDSLWNGLISANLPLFTAGRIRSDVRTALSQLRQAKLQQQAVMRLIEQEVRTAHENFDAAASRRGELRWQVEAAQQALDVAEGEYQAGRATYLDRLIAQDRLLSAQLDLSSEEFNRKLNYLNLQRVTGDLRRPGENVR